MCLERTEKASLQAGRLTKQLLTFAKGGAPVKKTASVADLIEDSIHFSLSGSINNCECHLPESPWGIIVDDGQIRQVLQNLIINANQAMPNGGTIMISVRNQVVKKGDGLSLKEGRYVRISVEDHGIGIPKTDLQKIFDPFYSTKAKGSGLGLAVSHSIISKHDGLITVESEVGKGTIFHIFLPATREAKSRQNEKEQVLSPGKAKILVMDDEKYIRELTSAVLENLGYSHEHAKDGQEAIKLYEKALAEERPFDLIIMDLTIPGGMGGQETLKRLLALDPKVKAIVSSGYSKGPIMTNYREYGFCGVIAKPYDISELSRILEKCLGSNICI
jgi:CheY-like chemotaxis protein/anti-sigma regulatory factor (Ser/Thr protein kinase)